MGLNAYDEGRRRARDRKDFERGYASIDLPEGDQPGTIRGSGGLTSSGGLSPAPSLDEPRLPPVAPNPTVPVAAPVPPAMQRAQNVAKSKADGTFETVRRQFNAQNVDQQMDEQGVISPKAETPAASAQSGPRAVTMAQLETPSDAFELTYQKANNKFYGETRDGRGQEFDTQAEASAFSRGHADSANAAGPSIDEPRRPKGGLRPASTAMNTPIAPAPAAPAAIAPVTPVPTIQPGKRVAASGPAVAPRGRGADVIRPVVPQSATVLPKPVQRVPIVAPQVMAHNAPGNPISPAPALDLANSPISPAPVASPVTPPPATGLSALGDLDALRSAIATSPAAQPVAPIVDAGPSPEDSQPAAVNMDLPPLSRPVGRSRPRASIRPSL